MLFRNGCQKQQRIDDSESCLQLFRRDKSFCRFVTMDELGSDFSIQSLFGSQLSGQQLRSKKQKTEQLAGKVIALVFGKQLELCKSITLKKA